MLLLYYLLIKLFIFKLYITFKNYILYCIYKMEDNITENTTESTTENITENTTENITENTTESTTYKFDLFLHNYELMLKQIYITALYQHGKGILVVDINSNVNGQCNTKYISINDHQPFWDDIGDIRDKIIKNEEKKVYFYLIDNKYSVILDREYE